MKLCARIGTPFSFAAFTAVIAKSVPIGLMLIAWTPFSSNCWTVVTNAWKSPSLAGACTSIDQPSASAFALAPSTIATWNGLVSAGGTKPTFTFSAGAGSAGAGAASVGAAGSAGAGSAGAGAGAGCAWQAAKTTMTTSNRMVKLFLTDTGFLLSPLKDTFVEARSCLGGVVEPESRLLRGIAGLAEVRCMSDGWGKGFGGLPAKPLPPPIRRATHLLKKPFAECAATVPHRAV